MAKPELESTPILCVEDDSTTRKLLVQILKARYANVLVAKDGAEGLDLFLRHRPGLVLTDIQMPGLDGIQMARAIKAECPSTGIIVLTARDDTPLLLSAIEIGVTEYVLKPLAQERIFSAIAKCLRVSALERELRTAKARTETILESIGDAFFALDEKGHLSYFNQRAAEHFQLSPGRSPELPFLTLYPEFEPHQPMFQEAMTAREIRTFEHFTASNGHWHEVRVFPLGGGVSVYLRDITEAKLAEEKIRTLAFYDKLTGLPNRTLLLDRISHAIQRRRRSRERCAVLFVDLDSFKNINDSLGHDAGDEVLREVARRLILSIRDSDTAARLGGDEFVVLLEGFDQPDNIHTVTHRILLALGQEIRLPEAAISVTASIGISFFPEDAETVEDLLKAADTAMYHSKKRGRNTYQFYRKEMNANTRHFLLMEHALRQAVQHQEFMLYYQPQYDLRSRVLTGFEALVRWRHPDLGLIPPAEFLPLAEDTGFILQLGDWILLEACRQARRWLDRDPMPLRIAVNLSGRQFWQEDLLATIHRILAETGLPPECLELELNETMVMPHTELAITRMQELTALGVRLAVDGFGTGYSSLAVLRRYPVHNLKLDQTLTREISTSPSDAAIVTAIIALAHSMDFTVVAVGIETRAQLACLLQNGCEAGQGYLFSPAIPGAQVMPNLLAMLPDPTCDLR
ncbi:MAG: EAL domain-containing protein [Holophaga sp.]|nr:EAL domain-containing protein [Holophaga sp.]